MPTNTERLDLFKYDVVADANRTFNITNALNNNWDKLENDISLTNYKSDVTYSSTQWVKDGDKLYKSLQNSNTGHATSEADWWEEVSLGGSSHITGQIIYSLDPLEDAGIHLLDGEIIQANGIYKDFVTKYIANLKSKHPDRFTTEEEWQAQVTKYGVCGKYVYTEGVSVRLPKVTGLIEGTLDVNALGEIIEAGIPNIRGFIGVEVDTGTVGGAFYKDSSNVGTTNGTSGNITIAQVTLDASRSSSVYSNSVKTVQPQTIQGYIYIVLANTTKTDITVNIDNIVTELEEKVDKSDMVEAATIIESFLSEDGKSGYDVYSNKKCVQWGFTTFNAGGTTVTFLKPYKDANYNLSCQIYPGTGTHYGQTITVTSYSKVAFAANGGNTSSTQNKDGWWRAEGYIE